MNLLTKNLFTGTHLQTQRMNFWLPRREVGEWDSWGMWD